MEFTGRRRRRFCCTRSHRDIGWRRRVRRSWGRFYRSLTRFSRATGRFIASSGTLRGEHGYTGGWTLVKDAVRAWRQQNQEVFLPLSHPPGEAQVDFGCADVWLEGELTKVALFVMTLPYSDTVFIQAFQCDRQRCHSRHHRIPTGGAHRVIQSGRSPTSEAGASPSDGCFC